MKEIAFALLFIAFIFLGTGCRVDEISDAGNREKLEKYNVTWDTPSENSMGSMPTGNGDMGINLWVEKNGDLLFYLSKTDAWSENGQLLKIGKIRLSLSPNLFMEGRPFLQVLDVANGLIHIEAGESEEEISIDIWVDANYAVVEMDVKSKKTIHAT